VYCDKSFWQYDDKRGIWEAVPDEIMTQKAEFVCREAGAPVTAARIAGVLKLATGQAFKPVEWDQSGSRDICARNGVLHYSGGGKWEVRPYKREDYRRVQLPVVYDPQATCPRFMQYLREVFSGVDDAQDRVRALVEFMGLSLTATTEYERAMLLLGRGGNGKSKVLNLIQAMAGPGYSAAVELSQLDNRFQQSHLDGKLINVMSETSTDGQMPDGTVKKIISGETLTAERKFRDAFDFRPICKLWLATNHLPSTKDFSDGLFRRFTILQFPNRFDDRPDVDTELGAKLEAETSGVLNFCLDALADVYDRRGLTTPASSVEIAKGWKLSSDQVAQFLDEAVVLERTARTASSEVYRIYIAWTEQAGIKRTLNRKNFTLRLEAHGIEYGVVRNVRTLFGVRERYSSDREGAK
jgi:putative DNA primase/helicase